MSEAQFKQNLKSYISIASDPENKNTHSTLKALGKQCQAEFKFEEEFLGSNWEIIGKDILILMICRSKPSCNVRKYLFSMALVEALSIIDYD